MKIAILADRLELLNIKKDSTYAMMQEAAARGHALHVFEQQHLHCEGGVVSAHAARVQLVDDAGAWFRREAAATLPLAQFDAVLVRKDPPFDMEYLYSTHLLDMAQRQGARVFNRPSAVRNHNEKLAILEFAPFCAPTLVSREPSRLRAFHAEHGDVIFKPLDGMGGAGIFRVKSDALNLGSIIETLTANGRHTIMAQKFIPAIDNGENRVLVIGGKPVPFELARIPQNAEVRGNLAAGGIGVAQPISERDREIAEALGPLLAERGLLLVGLDVIGENLTEVNVTSPTCFQEIFDQTGFDVAAMFIDAVEQKVLG